MCMCETCDCPRDRILRTAITLFARKGYHAVGVREITGSADVNVSMVSYYFGGKVGILKAIIEEFFDRYEPIVMGFVESGLPLAERIRPLIGGVVGLMRSNPDLCKVGIMELPVDEPEIIELKAERVRRLKDAATKTILGIETLDDETAVKFGIIGPAVISMIFSNFLLSPLIHQIIGATFDDAFYDSYIDTITAIILGGIPGAVQHWNQKQGGTDGAVQ